LEEKKLVEINQAGKV